MRELNLLATYKTTLDGKHRFALPEQLLESLMSRYQSVDISSMVITPSFRTKSLDIFPLKEWKEKVADYIDTLDSHKQDLMRRAVVGRSIECEIDSENRLTITEKLIEYASLSNECLIAEYDYKLELWSPENFAYN